MLKTTTKISALCFSMAALTGCLELDVSEDRLDEIANSVAENAAANAESMFPTDFVVASPFETTDADGQTRSSASDYQRDFSWMRNKLRQLRHNRIPLARLFNASRLHLSGHDASCFGPALAYQNHPDGADPASGSSYPMLPSGDLGIWSEVDAEKGSACAAAQLNSKVKGLRHKTFSGLAIFAAMLGKASQTEEFEDLASTGTLDLTDEMNSLTLSRVYFKLAAISFDSETNTWSYKVDLDFRHLDSDDPASANFSMKVVPGETAGHYKGLINYRVDGRFHGGHCPSRDVETLGSVAFEKTSDKEIKSQARSAVFCGHDGSNGFDSDGFLDASYTIDEHEDGWANNFSIFTANFDPATMAGRFSYTWQAGPMDGNSRVFNIGMNGKATADGEAWYGYGDSLTDDDADEGKINGFICNWAGPGGSHALIAKAQRQFVEFNTDTSRFEVASGGSDITYAPVNDCIYDSDSGGSFAYDRDLDGDLSDESAETNDVGNGEVLTFDLFPSEGSAYDGMTLEDAIAARGFSLPDVPSVD